MLNFAKILRYQHTSLFDNKSAKFIIININISVKRVKTINSFEIILFFMFCFAALFAYLWVCLFKYVFKNDIDMPQQR